VNINKYTYIHVSTTLIKKKNVSITPALLYIILYPKANIVMIYIIIDLFSLFLNSKCNRTLYVCNHAVYIILCLGFKKYNIFWEHLFGCFFSVVYSS
jgi:hypothetical protein